MGGMHVQRRSAAAGESRRPGAGFTLIELMIVILIIGVVVAIVFPALSGARNAARRATTQAMMTELATASTKFYTEHNRYPGYFSAAEMASTQNEMRGFSAMENVMLDLGSGITEAMATNNTNAGDPCADPGGNWVIEVGPTTSTTVNVDLRAVGGQSSYVAIDKRYYQAQCAAGKQVTSEVEHRALPDVVDAWGQPLLAWAQSDPGPVQNTVFAAKEFPGAGGARARYYWNPNAAFLKSTSLGKLNRNQPRDTMDATAFSMVGEAGNMAPTLGSLTALLGNPAYPDPNDPTRPSRGRAEIVFHSAGSDGYYLGSNEVGAKQAGASRTLQYNPPAPNAVPGAPIPRQPDPTDGFDDIIVNAGNN